METSATETGSRDKVDERDDSSLALVLYSSTDLPTVRIVPLALSGLLGRDEQCDHCLPGGQASRRHAEISLRGTVALLRDLSSKNGTFLNGKRIEGEAVLQPQDVVRIGTWVGVVARVSAARLRAQTPAGQISELVFGGSAMDRVFEQIEQIAATRLRVMLIAETGCGKDVLARELHRLSRLTGRMVAMNCAAVPEQLAEGELFGYRKGAFTGADRSHTGHFRSAHEGTLFLDEVAELSSPIQAKILRALEEERVVPLGQSSSEPANARVVCAAQQPLHEYVENGTFRADLYSRLNGVEVRIPPLRERREEVLPLLHHLLSFDGIAAPSMAPEAAEQLLLYNWPLNVREAVQLVERTKALHAAESVLRLQHLPERIATYSRDNGRSAPEEQPRSYQEQTEQRAGTEPMGARDQLAHKLLGILHETEGNVSAAAARLGITRPRAYRLLKRIPNTDPDYIRITALRPGNST